MSHPRFFTLGAPAVVVAALLLAPVAWAGGGGHGGGGGGGGHGGGGGGHAGGGGYRGGYGGGNRGYGYGGFGIGLGLGLGYPSGYGYGYPYGYGGYGADYYPPTYAAPAASVYVTPPAVGGPAVYSVANPGAGGGPQQQDLTAHIAVKVPADAEVWFGQGKTQQTGSLREFVSPPLSPGKEYTYDIKARWMAGGQEVVQTRQVDVGAGAWKTVDFTRPAPEVLEAPKPKP